MRRQNHTCEITEYKRITDERTRARMRADQDQPRILLIVPRAEPHKLRSVILERSPRG